MIISPDTKTQVGLNDLTWREKDVNKGASKGGPTILDEGVNFFFPSYYKSN